MKITTTNAMPSSENDYSGSFTITVDGKEVIYARDGGEPEDNSLGRDLNFVFNIVGLMKRAYEAGKAGEEFELIELVEEDVV